MTCKSFLITLLQKINQSASVKSQTCYSYVLADPKKNPFHSFTPTHTQAYLLYEERIFKK